jgi:hypothetical protein
MFVGDTRPDLLRYPFLPSSEAIIIDAKPYQSDG